MNIVQKTIMHWRLRGFWKREKARIPELQKTIDTIKREHQRASDANLEHFAQFYNVVLFILVMDYDVSVLSQYYVKAYTRYWEKKFVARQMAILLYEASEDIPQLLGGDFRASLKTIPLWNEAEKELNKISKELNRFKRSHSEMLKELRNFVTVHRDHNTVKQMDIIDNLNPDKIYALLGDFYDIMNTLALFMIRIVRVMGNKSVILHHLSERNTRMV